MSLKNLNATKIPNTLKVALSNKKIQTLFNKFEKNFKIKEGFIVGVSGGPDSLALAFLTKIYSIKYKLNSRYFIVDHKLRKSSTNEAKTVKKILNNFHIKTEILTWYGAKPSKNIQSLARKKRYDLLLSKCRQLNISNLVIGHHLDDLYENFFIRMTRGSGLRGLVSLEKNTRFDSINVVRPLLDFEKKNLKLISNKVFNFFVKDPSNENTKFKRIKIRKIISQFQNNGLDKKKLFLTLKNLKKSDQAIKFYVDQNMKSNCFLHKDIKKFVLNENFFKQPYEIVFRSFSDCLKIIGNKYNFSRGKKIDFILSKVKKNTLRKETLAGCVIKRVNQTIIITKEY